MRKGDRKAHANSRSIRTLLLFLSVVSVLIIVSLSIRFVVLLQHSKFDGEHRFTILVRHDQNSATVLSFDPMSQSVSRILVRDQKTLPDIGRYLGIPIDGILHDASKVNEDTDLSDALFSYYTGFKSKEGGLTAIDLFRLWLLSLSVQNKDIETKILTGSLADEDIDAEIDELFIDRDLASEKISVEIVNATGITGKGSRLERMVNNMGIPVVQVTTATSPQNASVIRYVDEGSDTFQRLSQLLAFTTEKMVERKLSDIIIIVGRDAENHPMF